MVAAKVRVKYEQTRQTRLTSHKKKNNNFTPIKVICFLCQATQAANIALAANQN